MAVPSAQYSRMSMGKQACNDSEWHVSKSASNFFLSGDRRVEGMLGKGLIGIGRGRSGASAMSRDVLQIVEI